jgi:acetolactate synthase-1/2/3 large subunit
VVILGDDVGTVLKRTAYHTVCEGYGGKGLLLKDADQIGAVLDEAKRLARQGHPVVVNAWIDKSDFRKGSISI